MEAGVRKIKAGVTTLGVGGGGIPLPPVRIYFFKGTSDPQAADRAAIAATTKRKRNARGNLSSCTSLLHERMTIDSY